MNVPQHDISVLYRYRRTVHFFESLLYSNVSITPMERLLQSITVSSIAHIPKATFVAVVEMHRAQAQEPVLRRSRSLFHAGQKVMECVLSYMTSPATRVAVTANFIHTNRVHISLLKHLEGISSCLCCCQCNSSRLIAVTVDL